MLDDWKMLHETKDLPPEAWQFIKDSGILGMIIKKEYGGLEFSNYAHAKVVMKVATRAGSAAVTVMVPNSFGPGRIAATLRHRSAEKLLSAALGQGLEIPCFALHQPACRL